MKPFDFQKYLKNNPLLKESVNEGPLGKLGNLTDEQEVELAKKAAEEVFRNWKKITGYTDPNDPKSDPVKYSKLTDVGVRANGEDWDYPKGVYNFLKQKPYNYVDIGIFNGEFINLLDAAEDSQSVNEAPKINELAKVNKPKLAAFLSRFNSPSDDEYSVMLEYYDHPSIPTSYMSHAGEVFTAVVEACGGIATPEFKGAPGQDQKYAVKGCPFEVLEQAWEYLGSEEVYEQAKGYLVAANGAANTWMISKV